RWRAADDAPETGEVAADQPEHATIGMRSPTVAYGDPPLPATMHHEPHEGTGLMLGPVVLLAGLAVVGGVLDLPFTKIEFLNEWLDPAFRAAHQISPAPFAGAV